MIIFLIPFCPLCHVWLNLTMLSMCLINTLITVINTLVLSKFFYSSFVWCKVPSSFKQFIALHRIISDTRKFDHVTPTIKDLCWLPLKPWLYFHNGVPAFKFMTVSTPSYPSSQFMKRGEVSGCLTPSSQLLQFPLFNTKTEKGPYSTTLSLFGIV